MNKGWIAVVLCCLMLQTFAVAMDADTQVSLDAAEQPDESLLYTEEIQALIDLELLTGYTVSSFHSELNMKRDEFCMIVSRILNFDETSTPTDVELPFRDVPSDHWAIAYITNLYSMGVIHGDGTGMFRPDDSITRQEVIGMMLYAMGYEQYINIHGGYPLGIYDAARLADVPYYGDGNEILTKGQIAKIIFEYITGDMFIQTSFGATDEYDVIEGRTLLSEYHDIYDITGQVTANSRSGINTVSGVGKSKVCIEDMIYDTGKTNAGDMLGKVVTAFYRDDNSGLMPTLLTVIEEKTRFESVVIDAEDILSDSDNSSISYEMDNNKIKRLRILPTANIIRNGVYTGKKAHMAEKNEIYPLYGSVTVIDANRDGSYELIFVDDIDICVVSEIDFDKEIIYGRYDAEPILLENAEEFRIVKGTSDIGIADLSKDDVLSVRCSDNGEWIDIQVATDNVVEGTVKEVNTEGDCLINDVYYEQSVVYKTAAENNVKDTKLMFPGLKGKFLLDSFGRIAAVDVESDLNRYAFLIDAKPSKMSTELEIKLFAADGRMMILDAAEKMKIDGVDGITPKETYDLLTGEDGTVMPQLVVFRAGDNGELKELDTVALGRNEDENNLTKSFDFVMQQYSTNLDGFVKSTVAPRVLINGDTAIIGLPSRTEDGQMPDFKSADESDFSVLTPDTFEDNDQFEISAYNVSDVGVAKAVLVLGGGAFGSTVDTYTSSAALIVGTSRVFTDDGEKVKIKVLVDGAEKDMVCSNEVVVKQIPDITASGRPRSVSDLKPGTLVQYSTNSKGEIGGINILLPQTTDTVSDSDISWNNNTYGWANDKTYGTAKTIEGEYIAVKINDESPLCYYRITSAAYVYKYSAKKETCEIASLSDIKTEEVTGKGSKIFLRIRQGSVKDIVIYEFE